MAFTADEIIANIESRLGDSGAHVWSFYRLASGTPWCSGEVSYTFDKTGNRARIFDGKPVFYVPTAQIWMAEHWQTVYDYRSGGDLSKVRKGDVVIFMWTRGSRDHIGFARATGTSGKLHTIEGNTSGGKVAERTREKKYIYGVYRPPYQTDTTPAKPAAKPKTDKKKALPTYKTGSTYTVQVDCLNVRTGPGTAYAAKKLNQLTPDGRKHANSKGQLNKGTRVTCAGMKTIGSEVWVRIPSGWICAYNGKKQYLK